MASMAAALGFLYDFQDRIGAPPRGLREHQNRSSFFYGTGNTVKIFSGNNGTSDQVVGIKRTLIYS